ncbi:MAG: gluconate:H+ symporter [Oscillospiraceae bacterium]|nr:gluconate:H+ symporter [Oscillospiraceae bacterium]
MTEAVFTAEPMRLIISAIAGIAILLILILKCKLHPVLSLLISALAIGLGSGMPVTSLMETVEYGAGNTLQGIVLLIGLGSMFGGILEVSGGAQSVAQTMVNKFGESKASWALGLTGLVVGTTVFFEAGVVILIPLAFGLAKKTKKSTLAYVIPLLAGLATGFAFIPPSAGSVLVANMLGVNLGVMIAVGVPVGIIAVICAGVLWGKFCGKKIYAELPSNMREITDSGEEKKLPPFGLVLGIILIPLVLILMNTITDYISMPNALKSIFEFLGTPFVALIIATLFAMYFLGTKQGYNGEDLKKILDRALKPTGMILLVITGGGIIRWVLQNAGMGDIIGPALEKSGLPLILVAFLIAALIRSSVGAAVVAMTMAAGIMASMPAVQALSPVELAAMVCAINGGATAFSHVNDSGFWLVGSLLEIDEKSTLKSWTIMETIIGIVGLVCALVISIFA